LAKVKVLWISAKSGKYLTFQTRQRRRPGRYFWIDGAGHNNLLSKAGIRYWGIIEEFTDMILTKDISE